MGGWWRLDAVYAPGADVGKFLVGVGGAVFGEHDGLCGDVAGCNCEEESEIAHPVWAVLDYGVFGRVLAAGENTAFCGLWGCLDVCR